MREQTIEVNYKEIVLLWQQKKQAQAAICSQYSDIPKIILKY
jgi:hypothetical protein